MAAILKNRLARLLLNTIAQIFEKFRISQNISQRVEGTFKS